MSGIEDLRKKIEFVDDHIYALILPWLDHRNEIAKRIAEYKKVHGLPIFDEVREKELLKKSKHKELCQFLMDMSKRVQEEYLSGV